MQFLVYVLLLHGEPGFFCLEHDLPHEEKQNPNRSWELMLVPSIEEMELAVSITLDVQASPV